MIEVPYTQEQRDRAATLYDFHNIKNSITKGKSELWGALGEVIIIDLYDTKYEGLPDYDCIINGHKIDVKTKKTTVRPRPDYNCSIVGTSVHQKCDFYFFLRVNTNEPVAYLMGYMSRKEFLTKAEFNLRGEAETKIFDFTEDCFNLPMSEMNPFSIDLLKKVRT